MKASYAENCAELSQDLETVPKRKVREISRRRFLRGCGLVSAGALGGFLAGRLSHGSLSRGAKLDASVIFQRCVNSVVIINIHASDSFGAGFCLDRISFKGRDTNFVATADHVTDGSHINDYQLQTEAARVTSHAGQIAPIGEAFVRDSRSDMAIFSCDLNLKPLSLAAEPPAIGETIFTLGHPLGDEFTLSSGIVSGYRFDGSPRMQITAPISPGSSGGPVLNQWGEVVGLVSSYREGAQNLNLIVPLSELLSLKSRLHALERTV